MVFADSVNLARRLSSKNENDLMPENMMDKKKDYKQCKILVNKISNVKDLPNECFQYKDIVASFQRKPTKSDAAIAFEGMGAGKASQNYAQIQRRYTNSHRRFTKEKK